MTKADIQAVIDRLPRLTYLGIGVFDERKLPAEERQAKFLELQRTLLDSEEECTRVCGWLAPMGKTKTMNPHHSSYRLKHLAENATGDYVSNGAFIAAAIHMGFPFTIVEGSANVDFGISERSLKEDLQRQRAKGNHRR
jgi:hypothetical protein